MKSIFFKKVFLLLLPVFVIFIFPIFVEVKSGETLSLSTVMERQLTTHPVLYGAAYSDDTVYYKVNMMQKIQPDIIALGNSKILTMRSEFFASSTLRFYNAGSTTGGIEDFKLFLQKSGVYPKVIIMTVEPLHFSPSIQINPQNIEKKFSPVSGFSRLINIVTGPWSSIYGDYFAHKFTIDTLLHASSTDERIGLNALVNDSGLRNDGSYHYGNQYSADQGKIDRINDTVSFIENKALPTASATLSPAALSELDAFLAFCAEHNIQVIGYIPPTPHAVVEAYKKYPSYDYVFHIYENTNPIFQKYNFRVFDFFDMATLNVPDTDAVDGYHTDEKVMVQVLIQMAQKDTELSKVVDIKKLTKIFNTAKDSNNVI